MKIFVIGTGGFIGSSISSYLMNAGFEVTDHLSSLNGSITYDSPQKDTDVIFNATGRLSLNVDLDELTHSNTALPSLLSNFCSEYEIHLIHLSSPGVTSLYAHVSENVPLDPRGDYETTKMQVELILRKHMRFSSEMLNVLRPDLVYCHGDLHTFELFLKVSKRWVPLIRKNGVRSRPTCCTDVVCRAVEFSLPGGSLNGGLFNIGDPEIVTVREFAYAISEALGTNLCVISIPYFVFSIALLFGPLRPKALSRSRLRLFGDNHYVNIEMVESTGFRPIWDPPTGIEPTVSWYKSNELLS